jgi:hypothetical protein
VAGNHLTNGEIGIELENTLNTVVRRNVLRGNVAGVLIIVLPGLPRSATDGALIEDNVVARNNLPNPFPAPPPFFDDLQLLPSGTGILNAGGDDIVIRRNTIIGNDTVGVGIIENPFGFGPPGRHHRGAQHDRAQRPQRGSSRRGPGRRHRLRRRRDRKLLRGQHVQNRLSARHRAALPAPDAAARQPTRTAASIVP